jgi:integrase
VKGSIQKRTTKRGDVSYLVRVELPADPTTNQRRQRAKAFPTKKAAETELAKWITEVERGTAVDVSRLTLAEYLTNWLDGLGQSVRPQTRRRYTDLMRQHVATRLGSVLLAKLAAPDVRQLYSDLLGAGLSNMTVRMVHMVLHRALKQAVQDDLIGRNVTEAVKAPRRTTPEYTAWTAEQAARFLLAADHSDEPALWRLALLTGMRRGELLGIKWEDIDFDRGTLAVQRSRSRSASGGWTIGAPKTASGRRSVALPPTVVEVLRRQRTRQREQRLAAGAAYTDQGFVFTTPLGAPLHINAVAARFDKVARQAGVPRIRFHDLRHTAATLMLANGEHPKKVQAQLGHANISITLDRYSHVTEGMQRDAADRLEELIQKAAANG